MSSNSQQYGIHFITAVYMDILIKDSHIYPAANFTFFTHQWTHVGEYDWVFYGNDRFAIRYKFYNNTFEGLGQWYDAGGTQLKAAGSRIDTPKYIIYKNNTFLNCGNAGYVRLSNTVSQAKINFTENTCTGIRHTCMNWANGAGSNFIAGNNTCNGRWVHGMVTTSSICHYSADTIDEVLSHTTGTALGYSSDFVGPNTRPRVHDNYWYNTRMGDDFTKYIVGGHIWNCTYKNIEQIGVYLFGGSHDNIIERIRMTNVTPHPDPAGQNGDCLWVASRHSPSNPYGNPYNNTFRNITCDTARLCISISDSASNFYHGIRCTNISADAVYMESPTTAEYPYDNIITKSNFTNVGGDVFSLDSDGNLTFYWNNFYDVGMNVVSPNVLAYNTVNLSGNYWSNDTTPDVDSDGIVDHVHNIPTGNADDNYPLVAPFTGSGFGSGTTNSPPTCVGLIRPVDPEYNENIQFNYTCSDVDGDSLDVYCNVTRNGTLYVTTTNTSIVAGQNKRSYVLLSTITRVNDTYALRCRAEDNLISSGWSTSVSDQVVDTQAPVITTTAKTVEYGSEFSYNINATDGVGVSETTWKVNDTTHFSMAANGILTNKSVTAKTYYLRVTVNDSSQNTGSSIFSVTVSDVVAPAITDIVRSVTTAATFQFDINASDYSGINESRWGITSAYFNITTNGIIRNKTAIAVGTYNTVVWVYDNSGTIGYGWLNLTVTSTAVGFNYSYGSGISSLVFNPATLTSTNVAPDGQSSTIPAYIVCNNGAAASTDGFETRLNASLPTGITMKMYTSNSPSSAKTLTTAYQYVNGTGSASVAAGGCNWFWVWIDLSNPTVGGSFDLLWRLT
jgi:hypothetical protein